MSEHGHTHGQQDFGSAFAIGVSLNLVYVVVEAAYGLHAHSLALVADAGHNMGDVLGLALAWAAVTLARRRPTRRYTYGLRSTSILAALINALVLLLMTGGIAWEAVRRLSAPEPAGGLTIIVVAAIGVLVNALTALLFASGRKGDLNIRAAFVHMASDAVIALGVVIAGALMLWKGWAWLDPVVSLAISLAIVLGTWGLLRDSVNLALAAVPEGIDGAEVEAFLAGLAGVEAVHDLHILGMSTTEAALTAHLVCPMPTEGDRLVTQASLELHERFGIEHITIQVETGAKPCKQASAEVV